MIKLERLDDSYIELYDRLGGAPVLERAVRRFHEAVFGDAQLAPLLAGLDAARLLPPMTAFFTMIYGGPNAYDGPDLRNAFAPLRAKGLTDAHLETAIGHFRTALAAQGASPALITEAESYLQSMRDDMLGL